MFLTIITMAAAPLCGQHLMPDPQAYRITSVSIADVRANKVIPAQDVYIRDGRIVRVQPSGSQAFPGEWRPLDGTGKFLMPGISEMHAHIPVPRDGDDSNVRETLFLYLSNGITTIRGMLGDSEYEHEVPIGDVDLNIVLAYDSACFAAPRPEFLKLWLKQPESNGFAVVEGGTLKGYGLIRTCRAGHKIGPLFADSPEIAERIYRALAATVPGDPLYLDVPLPNEAAVALAKRHRMTPVFETARMYTQGDPGVPIPRVFGVTTFELG